MRRNDHLALVTVFLSGLFCLAIMVASLGPDVRPASCRVEVDPVLVQTRPHVTPGPRMAAS